VVVARVVVVDVVVAGVVVVTFCVVDLCVVVLGFLTLFLGLLVTAKSLNGFKVGTSKFNGFKPKDDR